MEELHDLIPADSQIEKITLNTSTAEILIRKWDNHLLKLVFNDCFKLCDKSSIGQDISHLIISKQSLLIDEIRTEIIDGGGTAEEIFNVYYVAFLDSWEEKVLLELIAVGVDVVEVE